MSKKVFVSGRFNVLHPGHLRLLQFAKELGGELIVGIESDQFAGIAAHVPEKMRLEAIRSISMVDECFIMNADSSEVIKKLKPDIVVKGKEHEGRYNPEKEMVESYGGRLIFSSGEVVFSSLDLIKREFESQVVQSFKYPVDYFDRHNISNQTILKLIDSFSKLRVSVVGDLIVDEYISCQPLGMSQEDPTIVVTPLNSSMFLGGAGIVAAHGVSLGASVDFYTIVGQDSAASFAENKLVSYGVKTHFYVDENRPTTHKQRYRCQGKTMLRVSHLHQEPISREMQERIYQDILKIIDEVDLLIFSDFNYGALPQSLVDELISLAHEKQVLIAADSQSSSQTGDIARYKNADLLTPTEREARISVRNNEAGLVVLSDQLKKQSCAKNILLKLGAEGLLIHADQSSDVDWLTDRIDALNLNPKDVAGAGDSLLIASALTMVAGGSIWESAYIGSLAAAIQVGRVGNIPIEIKELVSSIVA